MGGRVGGVSEVKHGVREYSNKLLVTIVLLVDWEYVKKLNIHMCIEPHSISFTIYLESIFNHIVYYKQCNI